MNKLNEEVIVKLKEQHGEDIHALTLLDGTEIVIKPLSRKANAVVQQKVKELTEAKDDYPEDVINAEVESLLMELCVIFPSKEEFEKLLESRAGIGPTVADNIYALSGFFTPTAPIKL